MSRNGSGVHSPPASSFPVVSGTLIDATKFNTTISDISAALTQSIANDGQTPILANLPMGGFKLTGLAAGVSPGDSIRFEQLAGLATLASPAFTGNPTAPTPTAGDNDTSIATTAFVKTALDSPALTGTPTAPTSAQFDNDTSIATTAFVQRALGNASGFAAFATSDTLNASHAGYEIQGNSGSSFTLTLPLISTFPAGTCIDFINVGAGTMTVARQGADVLLTPTLGSLTSIDIKSGDTLKLISAGDSNWYIISGSAALRYATDFGALLATNGYQKLPSGIIIQWGTFTSSATPGNAVAITLPIFVNNIYSININATVANNTTTSCWFDSPTGTGFNGRCNIANLVCMWTAITKL